MSGVPYIFGNATTSIPLSQLDVNFATNATIGTTSVGLGNTTTTLVGLTNVSTTVVNTSNISANTSLLLQTNGTTTAVTIDTNQNVGIGTSSPAVKLQVQAASTPEIRTTDGTNIFQVYSDTTNGGVVMGVVNNAPLVFRNNATERARIDTSGNLLVGTTTTPTAKTNSITAYAGFVCRAGVGGATANIFNINWTGSPYLWIDSTNIGQIATVSDYRLKENVTPQKTALDKVMQLQPVEFNRKAVGIFGGSSDIEEGFLAHELQAIIPSAVYGEKDAVTEDGSIQPQSLNWSPVVSVLVKAIQEQQAMITTLQTQVTALKGASA